MCHSSYHLHTPRSRTLSLVPTKRDSQINFVWFRRCTPILCVKFICLPLVVSYQFDLFLSLTCLPRPDKLVGQLRRAGQIRESSVDLCFTIGLNIVCLPTHCLHPHCGRVQNDLLAVSFDGASKLTKMCASLSFFMESNNRLTCKLGKLSVHINRA